MIIEYIAKHKYWNDILILDENDKTFYRNSVKTERGTYIVITDTLILKWERWEPEILETINNGFIYSSTTIFFTLEKMIHHNNKFVFIIPFKNAYNFIEECANSVISQTYHNWVAIFCDDNSTDNTIEKIPKNNKFIIRKNDKTLGPLLNKHISIIETFADIDLNLTDEDVICLLDGDDYLLVNNVLKILDALYSSKIILTYGYHKKSDGENGINIDLTLERFNNIRDIKEYKYSTSHLKTFRYKLYKELLNQDPELNCFKDKNGNFYTMASDVAIMIPLIEIAGINCIKFNKSPIYFYRLHDNNIHNTFQEQQIINKKEIFHKPSFKTVNFNNTITLPNVRELTHLWINISSYKDRKNSMEEQFKKLSIKNIRIEAHTPKDIPEIIPHTNYSGTNLEYACLSSHIKAIKTGLEMNLDWFIVMEDDMLYNTELDYSKILNSIPKDAEILQLFTNNGPIMNELYKYYLKTKQLWKFRDDKRTYSTGIYLISKKGGQKISNLFPDYPSQLDFTKIHTKPYADWVIYESVITYVLSYPFFYENINLEIISIIHNTNERLDYFKGLIKIKQDIWDKRDREFLLIK